jgi:hypothetical protein
MQPRAVPSYSAPAYPTREELAASPGVLREHVPAAWQADRTMAGAVAFFLVFASAGCHGSTKGSARQAGDPNAPSQSGGAPVVAIAPAVGTAALAPLAPTEPADRAGPTKMVVAPVFEHGDGRGAVGCVVVSPPVFLAEDEAFAVLREELAKHGINLARGGPELGEVVISKRQEHYERTLSGQFEETVVDVPGTGKPLALDGAADKNKVAVKLVTQEEYFELGGAESSSSVQGYDLKGIAAALSERLHKQGREQLYVGVFYDPVGHVQFDRSSGPMPDWQVAQALMKDKSKDMLRQQVQDFVGWLRGRGAI